MTHLTVLQRTNLDGFPKAGELIEITGAHELEASDRAILNLLYQFAHDSGRMGEKDAEWSVPLARLRISAHESNDRLLDSLKRILRVVVTVPVPEPQTGDPAYLATHLFDFFTIPVADTAQAVVRFGIPKKLQPILARSNRWGRIKAEVVCAMTSKYAIALYELVQLRTNMDRCVETFPLERFRDLLGVPPGAYERGANFTARVTDPAVLEVNGLSDVGVDLTLVRRSKFAPIEAVTVAWWRKQGDEFRAAMRERDQSKVGRMARLKGAVEAASLPAQSLLP
ncbi:MAG: replication initiation protein [Rhodopila sp.]